MFLYIGRPEGILTGGLWTQYDGANSSAVVNVVEGGLLDYTNGLSTGESVHSNVIYGVGRRNSTIDARCCLAWRSHFITFGGSPNPQRLDIEKIVTFSDVQSGAFPSYTGSLIHHCSFVERSDGRYNTYIISQISGNDGSLAFDQSDVGITNQITQGDPQRLSQILRANINRPPTTQTTILHCDSVLLGNNDLIIANGDRPFSLQADYQNFRQILFIIPNANSLSPINRFTINYNTINSNQVTFNTRQTFRDVCQLGNPDNPTFQDGSPTPTPTGQFNYLLGLYGAPNSNQCAVAQCATVSAHAPALQGAAVTINLFNTQLVSGEIFKEAIPLPGLDLTPYYPNMANTFIAKPMIVYLDQIQKYVVFGRGAVAGFLGDQSSRVLLLSVDPSTGFFTVEDNILIDRAANPLPLNMQGHPTNFQKTTFQKFDPLSFTPNRAIRNNVATSGFAANQSSSGLGSGEAVFVMTTIGARSDQATTFNSNDHFHPHTDPANFALASGYFGTGLFAVRVEGNSIVEFTENIMNADPIVNNQTPGFWMDAAFYAGGVDEAIFAFQKVGGEVVLGSSHNRELELNCVKIKL